MIYVQILEKHDAGGFLALAKSGTPVYCLAGNIYVVQIDHIRILKRKRIPFKKLAAKTVPPPQILPRCMKRYEIYLPLKYNNGKEIGGDGIREISRPFLRRIDVCVLDV